MAYQDNNFTQRHDWEADHISDRHVYGRSFSNDQSFSVPQHSTSSYRTRPSMSSRHRSDYIAREAPLHVDYIAPRHRSRRKDREQRDPFSSSYTADYISRPLKRMDDHISPRYPSPTSTSTATYIEPVRDPQQTYDAISQISSFCQPVAEKLVQHQRHTSLPSFSAPYDDSFDRQSRKERTARDEGGIMLSHDPKPQRKSTTSKRAQHPDDPSTSPPRSRYIPPRRNNSPDAHSSAFQSSSEITTRCVRDESDYGSDFEPHTSRPYKPSAFTSIHTSDPESSSDMDDSITHHIPPPSFTSITIDDQYSRRTTRPSLTRKHSSFPSPHRRTPPRERDHTCSSSSPSATQEDSDASEEYGSDVVFNSSSQSRWDSECGVEGSDYVAESVSGSSSDGRSDGEVDDDDDDDDDESGSSGDEYY